MCKAPIILMSPYTGSGELLLRSLISGSKNGICYGEAASRRFLKAIEVAHSEYVNIENANGLQPFFLESVVDGDQAFVGCDLELVDDFAKSSLVGSLTFFKQHYDKSTESINREVWACLAKDFSFSTFVKGADFFPNLKCIFVYCNIFDVIKNQKALGAAQSGLDMVSLCARWAENIAAIAALSRNNFENTPKALLPVKLERLTSEPDTEIDKIESFAGVVGVNRKIVASEQQYETRKNGRSKKICSSIEAVTMLSHTEVDIVKKLCGEKMGCIYPELWGQFLKAAEEKMLVDNSFSSTQRAATRVLAS